MVRGLRPGEHIQALDGIRGLAILLVLIHHLNKFLGPVLSGLTTVNQLASMGWIGVDLFFVLSGFLITGILIDSKAKPNYYRRFYVRRVLRIFPLYYVGLLAAGWLVPAVLGGEQATAAGLAYCGVFVANWMLIFAGWTVLPETLTHFWSLCVEEQFYLVWPACVARVSVRSMAWVSAGVAVCALVLRVFVVEEPTSRYILTVCRMDALAMGAFLASARRLPDLWEIVRRHYRWAGLCAVAGLAGICFVKRTTSFIDPGIGTVGLTCLSVAFGALLVTALESPAETLAGRVFQGRGLGFWGKYSYGIYVIHQPVILMFKDHPLAGFFAVVPRGRLAVEMVAMYVLAVGISVALALLSWNLMEKRFLGLKERLAP